VRGIVARARRRRRRKEEEEEEEEEEEDEEEEEESLHYRIDPTFGGVCSEDANEVARRGIPTKISRFSQRA